MAVWAFAGGAGSGGDPGSGGGAGGYPPSVGAGGWNTSAAASDGKPICNGDPYTRLTLVVRPTVLDVSPDRQFLRAGTTLSGRDAFALVDGLCHYFAGDVTRGYVAEGTLTDAQAAQLEKNVGWSGRNGWPTVSGASANCASEYRACAISADRVKEQIGVWMDAGRPVQGSVRAIAWSAAQFGNLAYAAGAPHYTWALSTDLATFISDDPDFWGNVVQGADAQLLRALRTRAFEETNHTCFFASTDPDAGTGDFVAVMDLDPMDSFWPEVDSAFYLPL